MSVPRYKDAAGIMGPWPFAYTQKGADYPYHLSGATNSKAVIHSIKSEPTAGYDLNGKSFTLKVDYTMGGVPDFAITVTNTYIVAFVADGMTLDQVITQINSDTAGYGTDIAYNDSGFLKLQSNVSGHGSYLKLETIDTSEDIFDILGLFSETESWGGEVAHAPRIDPTRQVPLPGQSAMMTGEVFDSEVFNRLAIQMALSSDKSTSYLENKRLAIRKEATVAYGGSNNYFTLPGYVYTGPSTPVMEELIAILDDTTRNEILVEKQVTEDTETTSVAVVTDADGIMTATFGSMTFTSPADETGDQYVVLTDTIDWSSVLPAALDGLFAKIINVTSASSVVIQNVDPATGARITYNGTATVTLPATANKIRVDTEKVKVEGFYETTGLAQNVNQYEKSRYSGAITRIDKGNRIFCDTADFIDVIEGDKVVWTGSTALTPFSNNGAYRVKKKIDRKTLELCYEDSSPVILNMLEGSPSGSISVTTDGEFWDSPVIKFVDSEVIPPAGNIRVVYLGMGSFKDAVDEDVAIFGGNVRYQQEAEFRVQKALIGLTGPSADSLDDVLAYLYGDRRRSIEGINLNFTQEHYLDSEDDVFGRHADIHPDTVYVLASDGETVTIRNTSADDSGNNTKFAIRNVSDDIVYKITAQGGVGIGENANPSSSTGLVVRPISGSDAVIEVESLTGIASVKIDGNTLATLAMYTDSYEFFFDLDNSAGDLGLYNGPSGSLEYFAWIDQNQNIGLGGIGASTDTRLRIRSGVNTQLEILELLGYNDTQDEVHIIFKPHSATGADMGVIYAVDNDPTQRGLFFKSNYELGFLYGTQFEVYQGTTLHWYFDANGNLIPETASLDIGAVGKELDVLYANSTYVDNYYFDLSTLGYLTGSATSASIYTSSTETFKASFSGGSFLDSVSFEHKLGLISPLFKSESTPADVGNQTKTTVLHNDAALEFLGSDYAGAREWARMDTTKNFVIRGMVIEKGLGTAPVLIREGVWFCKGKIYHIDDTTLDASLTSSYLSEALPGYGDSYVWLQVFIHPTDGIKFGLLYPDINGYPEPSENISENLDTDKTNWTYLGFISFQESGSVIRAQHTINDFVYLNCATNIITTGSGLTDFEFTSGIDEEIPGPDAVNSSIVSGPSALIVALSARFIGSGTSNVDIYHAYGGSGNPAFSSPVYDSAGEDVTAEAVFFVTPRFSTTSYKFLIPADISSDATSVSVRLDVIAVSNSIPTTNKYSELYAVS